MPVGNPELSVDPSMSPTNYLVGILTAGTLIQNEIDNIAFLKVWESGDTVGSDGKRLRRGIAYTSPNGVVNVTIPPENNNPEWDRATDTYYVPKFSTEDKHDVNDIISFKNSSNQFNFYKLSSEDDQVVNGTFDTDTVWSKDANWSIGSGVATHAAGVADDIKQTGILTLSKRYVLTYTISGQTAGTLTAKLGTGTSLTARTSNGTYIEEGAASTTTDLIFSADSAFDGSIDNVTCIEVGTSPEDDPSIWQQLFMDLQTAQVISGAKTFKNGNIILEAPNGSDTTTLKSSNGVNGDVTLPTATGNLLTEAQIDAKISGASDTDDWQDSIIDEIDFTASEPASPTTGDRYINTVTGTSSVTSQSVTATYIYEWNGTDWTEIIPNEGFTLRNETTNTNRQFSGTVWEDFATGITQDDLDEVLAIAIALS